MGITYFSLDVGRHAEKQRDVEAQLDHVVPVLGGQQWLQEERGRDFSEDVRSCVSASGGVAQKPKYRNEKTFFSVIRVEGCTAIVK